MKKKKMINSTSNISLSTSSSLSGDQCFSSQGVSRQISHSSSWRSFGSLWTSTCSSSSSKKSFCQERCFRVLVLGSSSVGKTSIISQLLYDQFSESHQKTLQEIYCGVFDLSGDRIILDIEDTSGTFAQDFPARLEVSLTSTDAVLLVFDVTDDDSFEEVSRLRDLISSMENCTSVPIIVLANKTDLKWNLSADELEATVHLDWECGYVPRTGTAWTCWSSK
jgi:small GTP-binding protein